jgi:hypothetical protein
VPLIHRALVACIGDPWGVGFVVDALDVPFDDRLAPRPRSPTARVSCTREPLRTLLPGVGFISTTFPVGTPMKSASRPASVIRCCAVSRSRFITSGTLTIGSGAPQEHREQCDADECERSADDDAQG